jgi:hypothetical protein
MIENKVWLVTGAGRGLGAVVVEDEPSHIHIPRPSRVRRPGGAGNGAGNGATLSAPRAAVDAVGVHGPSRLAAERDEPSHIHIPRPSRLSHLVGAGNGATWGDHLSAVELHG